MGFAGVRAAPDLDRFYSEVFQIVESFFKGLIRQQDRKYADFHARLRAFSNIDLNR
jgi:hypothetical protein